jgi:adenylate cyclase
MPPKSRARSRKAGRAPVETPAAPKRPQFDLAETRHALRTPINHILGYCEMLLEEEDMPPRIVADLKKVHAGGKQLLELIARYLDEETFSLHRNLPQVQHELRTPVNHIIGYSELLIEQAEEIGQRRLVADLEKIRGAAREWLTLMESCLLPASPSAAPPIPTASDAAPPRRRSKSAEAQRAQQAPAPLALSAPAAASLLVVDDDDGSRELLARRLHRLGFAVASASDGPTALKLIGNRTFDLVLLDHVMPGWDGLETLKRIRRRKSMTDLPVIMVTGRDASGDVVHALKSGANDYLTKPVDFAAALARVTTQLQLRQAQLNLHARLEEIRRMAADLQVRNDFIKQVFGRYVTTDVVQSVLETPGGLKLGGQKRVVTILMSDLRGFTALAERLAPEKVVEMLNVYLGAMAEIITSYHGVIDEFIGDAILGIFGAPVPRADHAESAVACALAMQIEMERVNRRLNRRGIAPLSMGIGVDTGEVIVGNIGSAKRAKFGVVGAHVNLTGRIQSATTGGEILISEATAKLVGPALEVERTVTFSPKGASAPVKLFSVTGLRGRDYLSLPHSTADPGPAIVEAPVKCYRLTENKIVTGESFAGWLTSRSVRTGLLETNEPLSARTDLKLEIDLPSTSAVERVVYCKVMEAAEDGHGFVVHFTSRLAT